MRKGVVIAVAGVLTLAALQVPAAAGGGARDSACRRLDDLEFGSPYTKKERKALTRVAVLLNRAGVQGARGIATALRKAKSDRKRESVVSDGVDWCREHDTVVTAPTAPPTTAPRTLTYPNGAPVLAGFPRLVPLTSIDSRVQNAFTISGPPPSDQVVEVAPGVFTPFNPAVPELETYLEVPNDGDCVVRHEYFPNTGGACWNGVASPSV